MVPEISRGWFQRFRARFRFQRFRFQRMVLARMVREDGSRGFEQDPNSVEKPYPSTLVIEAAARVTVTNYVGECVVVWGCGVQLRCPRRGLPVDGKHWAELSLNGMPGGSTGAVMSGPSYSGALNGKAGGKAQRGKMSTNSRARSRRRRAPARKASTKAR